jgi:hypothetical protein
MEQRPMDSRRVLTLLVAGLFLAVATAAVVFGARSDDDQTKNLAAVVRDSAREETILVRLMAPDDGCWTRTITDELRVDDEVSEGCGAVTFPVRVRKEITISFERRPPASWTWCLVAAVDGKVVLTRGPDSNPEYSLDVYWSPPELEGTPVPEVEPVTCAES